jgi:hypothetical protein
MDVKSSLQTILDLVSNLGQDDLKEVQVAIANRTKIGTFPFYTYNQISDMHS